MNRKEIKRPWKRSRTDHEFRPLLLAMLAASVWTESTPKDELSSVTNHPGGASGKD
jgi:hypothetical protein